MSTAVIVRAVGGGVFVAHIDDKDWVPMEKKDVGKTCDPFELLEVKSHWHWLFRAPMRERSHG